MVQEHRYEAVLFQHGYMAQYIKVVAALLPSQCIKVASPEVLESRAFSKKSELARNAISRFALARESSILDRLESGVFNSFDRVAFFSQEDLDHYRHHGGVSDAAVVNLGIEVDRYPLVPITPSSNGRLRVAFFGAFSWFANTDALDYLLRDVWPVVEEKVSNVELLIAGRDIPDWAYKQQSDRLKVLGRVESISEFLRGVDVVLSPIRIGGGIRLKILESLAYGRTVLSTRVGLEGLDPRVVRHVMAVDTPEEYASVIGDLASNPKQLSGHTEPTSDLVRSIYDAKLLAHLFKPAGRGGA
jgi:glycosyltransferase involved in cell wall biosynthesis